MKIIGQKKETEWPLIAIKQVYWNDKSNFGKELITFCMCWLTSWWPERKTLVCLLW